MARRGRAASMASLGRLGSRRELVGIWSPVDQWVFFTLYFGSRWGVFRFEPKNYRDMVWDRESDGSGILTDFGSFKG